MIRKVLKEYRLPIFVVSIVLALAIVSASVLILLNGQNAQHGQNKQASSPHSIKTLTPIDIPVSPLLFGTNLGLFNSNDQFLNSTTSQALLKQIHTQIIRMPARKSILNTTDIQAARDIKSIGAIPLVVLHGSTNPTALADDTLIVQDMNAVFGKSIVYYEYGNEEDYFSGVNAEDYTAGWNSTVPQLKKLALNGNFIGPVNYQYSRSYLTTFLQKANPRPDEVSWHEYTCSKKDPAAVCLANIDQWTDHITNARNAMQTTIGTTLPIMITEWNYAPDLQVESTGQILADGKHDNATFMSEWTTKALQTLAANRVFASMQYSCTNTPLPLITTENTITTQGTTFANIYQQMIIQHQQPGAIAATVVAQQNSTPVVTRANGSTNFSFEDGTTDDWAAHGQSISAVQNSTAFAQDGKHSLETTISNTSSNDFPYVSVDTTNATTYPKAGQTLSTYIYTTSSSPVVAKIFLADQSYTWHTSNGVTLTPNTWTQITMLVPATFTQQPRQIGIQFNGNGDGHSITLYIDAVGWS